jgi:hypothetical protein
VLWKKLSNTNAMHQDILFFLKGDNAYMHLRQLLENLLPANAVYNPIVTKEQQKKQLETLDDQIENESFYFIFNLLTRQVENINGVDKWLGYSNKQFNVSQYLKCIHPDHVVLFNLIAQCIYKVLLQGIFKLHFATQKYISLLALRQYDGEYYVYKKTSSIFQYDDKNRMLAQLNEFSRIELYDGTALKPRIMESEGHQAEQFEKIVFQMIYKDMVQEKYFSKKEFEVLKYYSANHDITSKDVAQKMDLRSATIDTYNKRILEKAKKIFTYPFGNAKEVALRLKKEKIL